MKLKSNESATIVTETTRFLEISVNETTKAFRYRTTRVDCTAFVWRQLETSGLCSSPHFGRWKANPTTNRSGRGWGSSGRKLTTETTAFSSFWKINKNWIKFSSCHLQVVPFALPNCWLTTTTADTRTFQSTAKWNGTTPTPSTGVMKVTG